ncbi:MAG: ATP-dependent zinc protease [Roseitalea sp.]|jgi:hypothetical protein|uniref:ATP-dependent zinc protease n=1 Tax=Oceaniradius stylonematis TaxID=2184161 RepID=A0A3A8AAZ0_9HYPH|nr:RimK/LysX family protein [Oceaniradius stylonematis]MBO6553699.1 ATP-dependent zinc protease [Roseitalea sp.]MBO6952742.1 ATP-dependent zinc protease [Rhizobiaceae bacterium]RNC96433.1 MAG: ATP-dependent zinc protease [Oricola sp.]MBO6592771.1 ATP-dependent zinc protease [Roseitalea sp.]MBO6600486.1 ATP-dependent zinc protease [Roseitalea sp.]
MDHKPKAGVARHDLIAHGFQIIGWREKLALPDLGVDRIRAKIDTGALTSALHVDNLEFFARNDRSWVRFHPPGANGAPTPEPAEARMREFREVKSSSGQVERRCVIATRFVIGAETFRAEVTLTDRTDMVYNMLVGRSAMRIGRLIVDPTRSWMAGNPAWPDPPTDRETP